MTDRKRFSIQAAATLLQNANLRGFFTGRIYQGASKSVCVPGLNCYSCPGAVGACPLGSLQSFLGSRPVKLPYYVMGLLLFFGALLGRAVCGFLCPIGWLQELLHRIPLPKRPRGDRASGPLRKLKYLILALTVTLPLFFALTPFFCKYLCPAGTLAGILLALADAAVRPLLGGIFAWKAAVLVSLVEPADFPAVLQIPLPPRGGLRSVQPLFALPRRGGCGQMHPLRKVRRGLPHGRRAAQGHQQRRVHPLRRLCARLPHRRDPHGLSYGAVGERQKKHMICRRSVRRIRVSSRIRLIFSACRSAPPGSRGIPEAWAFFYNTS